MELIQKTIRYNQEGKKTFDQFYLDEDYNVPDAKQDVRRIIKGQGTVKIEDVKLVENYVRISGKLYFVCDGSGRADAGSTGWQDSV